MIGCTFTSKTYLQRLRSDVVGQICGTSLNPEATRHKCALSSCRFSWLTDWSSTIWQSQRKNWQSESVSKSNWWNFGQCFPNPDNSPRPSTKCTCNCLTQHKALWTTCNYGNARMKRGLRITSRWRRLNFNLKLIYVTLARNELVQTERKVLEHILIEFWRIPRLERCNSSRERSSTMARSVRNVNLLTGIDFSMEILQNWE